MAGNKFATMLSRNTNKFTLILVYAILEWVMIILLLLNSLFSYLIIKFADYFGLKRPCLWCSRLDHFFEPANFQNSYRSLVCDDHAKEISKLGYCSIHRKLAESQDLCEDCSSSSHSESLSKFAFFPWMKQLSVLQDFGGDELSENGEEDLKCSCCGVCLDTKLFRDDYCLMKPSWGDSFFTQKANLVLDHQSDDKFGVEDHPDRERSDFVSYFCGGEQGIVENRGLEIGDREEEVGQNCSGLVSNFNCKEVAADDCEKEDAFSEEQEEPVQKDGLNGQMDNPASDQPVMVQANCSKDMTTVIQPWHLEFYIDQDDCHLIPVELIDSDATGKQIRKRLGKGVEENSGSEDFVLEFDKQVGAQYELLVEDRSNLEEEMPLLSVDDNAEEPKIAVVGSMKILEKQSYSGVHADLNLVVEEEFELVATAQPTETPNSDGNDAQESSLTVGDFMDLDYNQVSEEVLQTQSDEIEADVSIGTEIPDQEQIDDVYYGEEISPSYSSKQEDPSTSDVDKHACEDGCKQAEEDAIEFRTITMETGEPSLHTESNELEEDKIPDTPTSIDSLHHLHKKLLLHERKESATEESLDGSIISDVEAGGGVLTMEKLKSALRAERKALGALYAELEEERSASAVAANQTMTMINRLQEEKAAMQMEALQYQRMMEEQSEYDQEALQLLNELMVKREKEKAEVEKELEVYRKKVQDYEMKEKLMVLKRRDGSTRSGTASPSCSNTEDSDELSADLNHGGREAVESCDNHQESSNQNTPVDAVIYLEESLANFEEERLSILEQLKVLEEKLFMLSDEEEQHFEDIKPIEHLYQEDCNGYNEIYDHGSESNGVANGHYKEMNGKHQLGRRNIDAKAKRLLPLFDAMDTESEDGILNGHSKAFDSVALQMSANKSAMDRRKLAVEEEVDHVYERLQALEADREFLKHCITSSRKGDKGIELLQDILQHLRDLRNVEQRARNLEDGAL